VSLLVFHDFLVSSRLYFITFISDFINICVTSATRPQDKSERELVMDTGVPWGVFGYPAPVPAEFPSRDHGCGISAKFPRAKHIFEYIELNIYNNYLIIHKIFKRHPSKFIRGDGKGSEHKRTPTCWISA
jgi:hypothetical protein